MWQPIETYPRCETCAKPDCDWGPEVLVLMPTEHGPVRLVAHLEAGEWLARDAGDAVAWGALERKPTHWLAAPDLPNTEQK